MIKLYKGNCNEVEIKEHYDYVISDLPYNTNYAKWDKDVKPNEVFNFKAKGFILFCVQPLTSELVLGNIKNYKYDMVWRKNTYRSNSFKTMVGRQHETILVFGKLPYNAQKIKRTEKEMQRLNKEQRPRMQFKNVGSVLDFEAINNRNKNRTGHPAEKPIVLYDWIFKEFAKPTDKILDTHLGSGSSRIAANKAGLDFVGFEIDEDYFNASEDRFKKFVSQTRLF